MTIAQEGAIRNRVARGIEYLEKEVGKGWWRQIKVTKLDMNDVNVCIAGQLFGDYFSAPFFGSVFNDDYNEDAGDKKGVSFGMQTPSWAFNSVRISRRDYFEALQVEWVKKIAVLRKG